jgi:hypothetical protein
MLIAHMLQYLDKQTLSYTSVMRIRDDLHLVYSQYNRVAIPFTLVI